MKTAGTAKTDSKIVPLGAGRIDITAGTDSTGAALRNGKPPNRK